MKLNLIMAMTMREKVTTIESESEMCVLNNDDYEKVKVKCLIKGNASEQRMADCPLEFLQPS